MKKAIIIFVLALISNFSFSQESFSHAIGPAGFLGTRNATLHSVGLIYAPRLNLFEVGKSSTFSIGTYLGVGYNVDYKFVDDNQITVHIPVIIEYNFGLASNRNSYQNKNGGFLGIGYSFEQAGMYVNTGNRSKDFLVKKAINGPIANIGYRFKIASEPFSIRASYLYGTGDFNYGYLATLSILYNMGLNKQ